MDDSTTSQDNNNNNNEDDDDDDAFSSSGSSSSSSWRGWTCDELTPALCGLQRSEGTLTLRGNIDVHYWMYTAMFPPADEETENAAAAQLPLVFVHGGPGLPHSYLLPLRQQACRGRTVIFYDQAGCGASSIVPRKKKKEEETTNQTINLQEDYPWLLDPLYYATEELPALLQHWGFDAYHIVGHAWGTMVAQLFALETKPAPALASMTLLGGLSDMRLWEQAMWDPKTGSLGRLPPFLQRQVLFLQANEMYESSQYVALEQGLRRRFMCRTVPLPDCYIQAQAGRNDEISKALFGPSIFANGGSMAHFNTTERLRTELAHVPVLLGASTFDIISPSVTTVLYDQLPLSEMFVCNKSGHVSAIDEPARTNGFITDFITRVEMARHHGRPFVPQRGVRPVDGDARTVNAWISSWPFALVFVLSLVLGFALARAILVMQIRKGYRRVGATTHAHSVLAAH